MGTSQTVVYWNESSKDPWMVYYFWSGSFLWYKIVDRSRWNTH